MTINLQTPNARAKLAARGKPHKVSLDRGLTLGYRKPKAGAGAWVVIGSDGNGGQWTDTFARADDAGEAADGVSVLSYAQATRKAVELAKGRGLAIAAPISRPATVDEAIAAYDAELRARGGNPYNASHVKHHIPEALRAKSLAAITTPEWSAWRLAKLTAGMKAATLNRMLKNVHACFALAAKRDRRLDLTVWKDGLEFIHGANTARQAFLDLPQVKAIVAAAYHIDPAFGLYCQAHAELGSRSDQIARITVGDLDGARIHVPNSGKGRGKHKSTSGTTPIPLSADLAARLATAAAGRPADALLLVQADGQGWTDTDTARRWFRKAADKAGIAGNVTLIAFRHSSIERALRAGVNVKTVADWHNTSVRMIETNYGKHMRDRHEDIIRAALVDTGPGVNIVPMRDCG